MDAGERLAVIDLGSNTFRLVVFSVGRSAAGNLYHHRSDEILQPVRLAEGLARSGRLQPEPIERALAALGVFAHFCSASGLGVDQVEAVATSAVREAANGSEFLELAERHSGLAVRLLSGEQEARYGFLAAVNTTTLADGHVLELGGGSMQVVEVVGRQPRRLVSLPLGAVNLTERFLPKAAPAYPEELERLRAHLRETLPSKLPLGGAARAVGLGGAVRNIATAVTPKGVPGGAQGVTVELRALKRLIGRLARLPAYERAKVPGIKAARADVILASAVLLEVTLELLGVEGLEATEAGLREGIFFSRLYRCSGGLVDDVRAAAVINLAARYGLDGVHSLHVAKLCLELFDGLRGLGAFEPQSQERELLWASALLHDIGMAVAYDDHHRHSRYLILNGPLPGFTPQEVATIAQIVRYHRKGTPSAGPFRRLLGPDGEQVVVRGATLLRLAEGLERARDQAVRELRLERRGEGVVLRLAGEGELAVQRWAAARERELFGRAFGVSLEAVEVGSPVAASLLSGASG